MPGSRFKIPKSIWLKAMFFTTSRGNRFSTRKLDIGEKTSSSIDVNSTIIHNRWLQQDNAKNA
jgi:hypothetical protein